VENRLLSRVVKLSLSVACLIPRRSLRLRSAARGISMPTMRSPIVRHLAAGVCSTRLDIAPRLASVLSQEFGRKRRSKDPSSGKEI